MTATAPQPLFVAREMVVEPEWIDLNGHLNMAYYHVLFDRSIEEAYAPLGFGSDYIQTRGLTVYTAEVHVCYLRELHAGDRVQCSFRLLDHDAKRMHCFQEMRHVDGWLAATSETMVLHIDTRGPRVAPFPPDCMERIAAAQAAQAGLPRPPQAGRVIGIRRRA
ncbi:thioesterase family protein [Ruixingdingia sedimenti]|uniref:Thioesterase family protein n=1 Tax=Ruixingdingia sedimenti TaxID=3073604 RepID=A0ABU1F7K1_9RHOB|nr:thioesterase family protein [Xinfangfangia sp. LG-4]MDR5652412.1 thioesterase family protein [Xinfangfangia sp. LG-4]